MLKVFKFNQDSSKLKKSSFLEDLIKFSIFQDAYSHQQQLIAFI